MADPLWGKISVTQTDSPLNIPTNWYFSLPCCSRSNGHIFHTWNGRSYDYNPSTNLSLAAGAINSVGWRENYGVSHDSDLNVFHFGPGTSGPPEWSGAVAYTVGTATYTLEASVGVGHAAHLWDPTRKTLRNFGGWTSNNPLQSRVTNPTGAWTATNPTGPQPPLTADGPRETCRRAVMDGRNGNMYVLADNQDLYKYTAATNAWGLLATTGTKPENFAVLGIHESANMLVTYCGDNSMVEADARVPTRTTRVLDLTALQWKLLPTGANDPLRTIMCQTALLWDQIGDRVLCVQTEQGTAYTQTYALTATGTGTPPTLFTVSVTSAGSGTGSVAGTGSYQVGATVDLTATPAANSSFVNYTQANVPFAEPFTMPAANVALVANWLLNVPDPPPPPPTDPNLLIRQWNPRPLPAITSNSAPFLDGGQTKDVNGAWDTLRKVLYLGTGDFTGSGGSQSGRPEIFAYTVESNSWRLVSGLGHPAGQITPNHPTDRGPMVYRSVADELWNHNAVPFPDTEDQTSPGGSLYKAGLLKLNLQTGVWTKIADRGWSSSLGGGAYDTATDSMLFCDQGGFGPGQGGTLRVVPLSNPLGGGQRYDLNLTPTPRWTGPAGGWLVVQQPERSFFAWDDVARNLYVIGRQIRLDAAGTEVEQHAALYRFSMVTRAWTAMTSAPLKSGITLSPYSIFCWWDANTSRVIWPVVTGPDGTVYQMLGWDAATDTWEDMAGSFGSLRMNCGFYIPSLRVGIGAGSVFDPLNYSQHSLFLWPDGPPAPNTGGDVTAPVCTLTLPAAGVVSGATVTCRATASDNVAVRHVEFFLDGGPAFKTDTGPNFDAIFNSTSVSDGPHTISARATDTSGNVSAFSTVTVTVQNHVTPPTVPPTGTITAPANLATVSGTQVVTYTVTHPSGIASVQLKLNGALVNTPDASAPYTTSWDTTLYANASYTLAGHIIATDGSTADTPAITVTVNNAPAPDTTVPVVIMVSPAEPGLTWTGDQVASATITDNVIVTHAALFIDDIAVQDKTAPTSGSLYTHTVATATYADGPHRIQWRGYDTANVGLGETITVTFANGGPPDTTPPGIRILSPGSGTTVSGTVPFTFELQDVDGPVRVEVTAGGVVVGSTGQQPALLESPVTVVVDTTRLSNGVWLVDAIVYDALGNSAALLDVGYTMVVSNTVTTGEPPPGGDEGGVVIGNTITRGIRGYPVRRFRTEQASRYRRMGRTR